MSASSTSPPPDDLEWEEWDSNTSPLSFSHHCLAGSFAGVAEHTLLYPLDTVKTCWQSQVCGVECGLNETVKRVRGGVNSGPLMGANSNNNGLSNNLLSRAGGTTVRIKWVIILFGSSIPPKDVIARILVMWKSQHVGEYRMGKNNFRMVFMFGILVNLIFRGEGDGGMLCYQ